MPEWLAGAKEFFQDSNNRNFAIGLLMLFVFFYIASGESAQEKQQRFFKVLLVAVFFGFLYGLYFFIKT